jgi:HTH-type transcriptional repressor of NAD biosynthesis genes
LKDSRLLPIDFVRIAHGHKVREYTEEKTANKILFIDTTALETQLYRIFYTHNPSKVIHEIAMNENYDLYLIQDSSGTDWVDDGVRINGDRASRLAMTAMFENLINLYLKNKPVVHLRGEYHDRYKQATSKINELMAKV